MSQWLKQSTAIFVQLGPFLDETDGKTAEVGLTITQPDVKLSKNGAAFAQKNDANAAVHDAGGWYRCQLDVTDTGTLGRLIVAVHESGALPVWREFMVVPANEYDSLISGSDALQVDAVEISGASAAADNVEANIGNLDAAISGLNDPTAAVIADAVWDELVAGHDGAGKAGQQLWTDVDAILTDTNELQTDDVPGLIAALNDPAAIAIADEVLKRGVANVEDAADTTSLAALVLAALESSIAGAVWTIRKTGGAAFVVKTVTVNAAADPVTGVT